MCPRDPLEAQRSAFQLRMHRENRIKKVVGIAIVACGFAAILGSVRFALGLRQGGCPETRLRDFIPQTPFFASRGDKTLMNNISPKLISIHPEFPHKKAGASAPAFIHLSIYSPKSIPAERIVLFIHNGIFEADTPTCGIRQFSFFHDRWRCTG